jgi:curved DNA-binding protein CbpA
VNSSHFDILGIPVNASDRQISEAYKQKKTEFANNAPKLVQIEGAYRVLANPISRKAYIKILSCESVEPQGNSPTSPQPTYRSVKSSPPQAQNTPFTNSSRKRAATEFIDENPIIDSPLAQPSQASTPKPEYRRSATEYIDSTLPPEQPSPASITRSPVKSTRQPTEVDDSISPPQVPGQNKENNQDSVSNLKTEKASGFEVKIKPIIVQSPVAPPPKTVERVERIDKPVVQSLQPEKDDVRELTMDRVEPTRSPYSLEVTYLGKLVYYPLEEGENVIGRPSRKGTSPNIPLPDPDARYISRKHAVITVNHGSYILTDCQSNNGTSINGVLLTPDKPYPLKEEDVILIEGRKLTLKRITK